MSQVFGENTGKGFMKEEEDSIFLKAIESAVFKSPVRNDDMVFLSDLWYITSLPEDLMLEVIQKYAKEIKIPEDINVIWDDKRNKKLWERPSQEEITEL